MIIAVPLDENKQDVCPSFGRAPFFLIYDSGAKDSQILENPAAEAQGGAGLKSSQFAADQDVDALVTIRCGENAAEVLRDAEIAIYKAEGTNALANAEACAENRLAPLTHFHAGFVGGH